MTFSSRSAANQSWGHILSDWHSCLLLQLGILWFDRGQLYCSAVGAEVQPVSPGITGPEQKWPKGFTSTEAGRPGKESKLQTGDSKVSSGSHLLQLSMLSHLNQKVLFQLVNHVFNHVNTNRGAALLNLSSSPPQMEGVILTKNQLHTQHPDSLILQQ